MFFEKITILGATHFFKSGKENNLEKGVFTHIYGCPLVLGIEIQFATDVCYINNVHWNANTYYGLYSISDGSNMHTKIAKNATAFKIYRADGVQIHNSFVFGFKIFSHVAYHEDIPEGGSVKIVNCAADVIHTFLRIDN